jgi:hypothetical protein
MWNVERIAGFGAIAVAIQQNENLKTLTLFGCRLSSSDMVALGWVLEGNGLENVNTCGSSSANGLYIACPMASLKLES